MLPEYDCPLKIIFPPLDVMDTVLSNLNPSPYHAVELYPSAYPVPVELPPAIVMFPPVLVNVDPAVSVIKPPPELSVFDETKIFPLFVTNVTDGSVTSAVLFDIFRLANKFK